MNQATVLAYLKHLGFVIGLAAMNVVLLSVLQWAGALNVATLPENLQGLAYLLLPSLVIAGNNLQQQLAKEIAQENAAKAMVELAQTKK